MKLISLGIADLPVPAAPAPQNAEMVEVGATGTPIFGGFLRDRGEYNPEFQGGPFSAYRTYEQMRRSDAQVAATLMAIKLPIRCAEWAVVAPADATPIEQEVTEFVRECLFDAINFRALLQNALLMLDFGAAAHEDVWAVDGNRIRLKKAAPRLPLTFYRWITPPDSDELVALEQLGYRAGEYVRATIPADKLALFTWEQEGANYAGRSILRPMYQHWYIKSNLYKVDAIACERNGMGVPWAKMAGTVKKEDREAAIGWLQQLSAHEKASILLPPDWDWGLKGVEGTIRDPKDSIHHHNMAIAIAGLAQFMMLGESKSGNRALGQTMADFFYLGLQATADQIAQVLSLTTVKRLCDYNFDGLKRYPKVCAQQILSIGLENIVAALKDLAAANVNAIQPDDELEEWLRKKLGAPEPGEPRQRPATPAPGNVPAPETDKTADAGPGKPGVKPEAGAEPSAISPADKRAGKAELSEITPAKGAGAAGDRAETAAPIDQPMTRPELKLRREPKGPERFLALSEITGELDRGRDEIAAALRAARSRVQAEIVNKLVNAPVRNMHRVSVAPDEKLTAEVEAILQRVYEFGVSQVEEERSRQQVGKTPSDAASVRASERTPKRDPLGVYADGVVSEFTNSLTSRAANAALDYARRPGDLTKGEIIRKVEEDLDGQSDKWIDGAASKGSNEAFADGRADGYEQHADEISSVIYSALLDINTCEACAAADGQEGATPDDIPDVPNPDCDGGDRCRCVHVFVFSDEVRK